MRASELFAEARSLGTKDYTRYLSAGLNRLIAASGISFWQPGEPIPPTGWRTLIGIAPYSLPELELLDKLTEIWERDPVRRDRVQIFDVLDCATMRDFEKYIPGIGKVYQTPVVGIWENGILTQKVSGVEARQLLLKQFVEG